MNIDLIVSLLRAVPQGDYEGLENVVIDFVVPYFQAIGRSDSCSLKLALKLSDLVCTW